VKILPNAKVLEQKKAQVAELSTKMSEASSGVLVSYKGINVEDDTKLRKELREAGVDYSVIKNSIILRAARQSNFEELEGVLKGTTALAISKDDVVAPARILAAYAKKHPFFEIKAGFVEGKIVDPTGVTALAELPSKEVLIATVLAGLNSPISGFVNVLNANIRGLAIVLNAIAEKQAG
jgi:large subunit ribosomal protein L10